MKMIECDYFFVCFEYLTVRRTIMEKCNIIIVNEWNNNIGNNEIMNMLQRLGCSNVTITDDTDMSITANAHLIIMDCLTLHNQQRGIEFIKSYRQYNKDSRNVNNNNNN